MIFGRPFWVSLVGLLAAIFLAIGPGQPSRAQDPAQPQTNRPRQATKPTPKPDEDTTARSDEIVRVDTALTNVLFTAADKQNRFLSSIKREDIRVFEDGVQQEIFTFQPNVDLPLSLAILIDTSASEEFTLPEEKAAARSFLETSLRANKDEASIVSFTGEVTLEQGLTGNIERLRHAIDRVVFAPPSGYIGGGITVHVEVKALHARFERRDIVTRGFRLGALGRGGKLRNDRRRQDGQDHDDHQDLDEGESLRPVPLSLPGHGLPLFTANAVLMEKIIH